MKQSALAAVQAVYKAFCAGDIPTVLGFLTPDAEWIEATGFPYGGIYKGPEAVLQGVFMRLGNEWDGFAATANEFIDAGDTVVALGQYSGKSKATGRSFVADFAHVWKVRNGKCYWFKQHVDTLLVNKAYANS